jgi:putative zinc finger protein/WD40 repeat protein
MSAHPLEEIARDRDSDGLAPAERATVRAHLAECASCRAYAEELARNDRLLSQRESVRSMPPFRARGRSGSALPAVLAATAVAALVVVTALGIARENGATPVVGASPTPPSSNASAAPATPSATAGAPAASASAAPTPTPTAGASVGTGPLTGNWIFVGKRIADPAVPRATVEIWGVPLGGGSSRLAYTYSVSIGGAPEGALDNAPYLRRQFSPDGKQIVLSVEGDLVIVELETGRARSLGVSGAFPAWSKDGSLIAFVRSAPVGQVVPPPTVVAVVAPTGGTPRDLVTTAEPMQSVEWAPDGRSLLVPTADGLALVEVASSRVVRTFERAGRGSSSVAHWRRGGSPEIALAESACTQGSTRIAVVADASAGERTLVDTGACGAVQLRDPRWNPVSGELLYIRARVSAGVEPSDYVVHLVDASGRDSVTPLRAYEATWSWDGAQIVYIVKADAASYGATVSSAARSDPNAQRELLRAGAGATFFSVASLSY